MIENSIETLARLREKAEAALKAIEADPSATFEQLCRARELVAFIRAQIGREFDAFRPF